MILFSLRFNIDAVMIPVAAYGGGLLCYSGR